ncbi:hypothetical protein GO755_08980 [Spirosoma sp. HMF4905]|uniref:DUF3575 domain-containing protein n=1 Tax=Spirosoma arboris TaxID=2682092 RepID=A0A7K1S8T3_9BACT|nr:hypothetical protein [Spirosoma arboris]MVM30165.1 hypothetical protein [Spirosoma arboris]
MKQLFILLFLFASVSAYSQSRFSKNELSINGFRNPSIGAEYRHNQVSFHAGYYPTAFKSGENTSFIKTGLTLWFLPVGKKENPSSFYAGASYLRGLNRDYENKNAMGFEAGFRWMMWQGLNLRIGAIAVAANSESLKINPTPGISYSFFFK